MKPITEHANDSQNSVTVIASGKEREPCQECKGDMTGRRKNKKTCSLSCSQKRSARLRKKRREKREVESHQKYLDGFLEYLKTDKTFMGDCETLTISLYYGRKLSFGLIWKAIIYQRQKDKHEQGLPVDTFINGWRRIAKEMMLNQFPDTRKMINNKKWNGK